MKTSGSPAWQTCCTNIPAVTYKRVEWWDQNEGALPNPDVQYPELQQAAAFLCTDRRLKNPISAIKWLFHRGSRRRRNVLGQGLVKHNGSLNVKNFFNRSVVLRLAEKE
jgi:hypothetical protein